jgi:hypothetical protein
VKIHKFSLIFFLLLVAYHVWHDWANRQIFSLVSERLVTHVMIGVMLAALLVVLALAVMKGHRDFLALTLAGATLFFLFFSRPVISGRLSLFLFFLLGVTSGLDEIKPGKWLPILTIAACALFCEGVPALMGSVRFFWMDALLMSLGGLSGRLVVCSNR